MLRTRPFFVQLAALMLCAAAVALARQAAQTLRPPRPELEFDIPPFPVEVAKPLSFGLSSLVADLTFIEAIQVHGGRKTSVPLAAARGEDRLLERLLDYSVDLDPRFAGAYRFAATALPRHTTDGYAVGVIAAERILRKGVRERPDDWHIAFELGFIESFYLGKMRDAAEAMAQAARTPGAPPYIGLLATRLAADSGDVEMGEQMAEVMAAQANEESTREEWRQRILDLRMERHLRAIEAAAARFQARTGRPAQGLDELVSAKEIAALPEEPHGGHYVLSGGQAHSTAAPRLRVRGRSGTQSGLVAQ